MSKKPTPVEPVKQPPTPRQAAHQKCMNSAAIIGACEQALQTARQSHAANEAEHEAEVQKEIDAAKIKA